MTQEEKELLLKDLCARLPYGVKCRWECDGFSHEGELTDICHQEGVNGFKYWDGYLSYDGEDVPIEIIKPYLRPMPSMTDEEIDELTEYHIWNNGDRIFPDCNCELGDFIGAMEWFNKHHFDYRGLIEKGLALEAPEGMYETHETNPQ